MKTINFSAFKFDPAFHSFVGATISEQNDFDQGRSNWSDWYQFNSKSVRSCDCNQAIIDVWSIDSEASSKEKWEWNPGKGRKQNGIWTVIAIYPQNPEEALILMQLAWYIKIGKKIGFFDVACIVSISHTRYVYTLCWWKKER